MKPFPKRENSHLSGALRGHCRSLSLPDLSGIFSVLVIDINSKNIDLPMETRSISKLINKVINISKNNFILPVCKVSSDIKIKCNAMHTKFHVKNILCFPLYSHQETLIIPCNDRFWKEIRHRKEDKIHRWEHTHAHTYPRSDRGTEKQ